MQRSYGNLYTNLVVVGKKALANYIFAVLERLQRSGRAILSAKGNLIGKACTVAEYIRQKYPNVKIAKVYLDSERYVNRVIPRLRIILEYS